MLLCRHGDHVWSLKELVILTEGYMETTYKGRKIVSKVHPLRNGEWLPEARVFDLILNGIREQQIFGQTPLQSKVLSDEASIQIAKKWIDSN